MRRTSVVLLLGILGAIFATIVINYSERTALPALAKAYVNLVPRELGAPNVITGILLTYRAFDTLGEVAVLFMVGAGVVLVLSAGRRPRAAAHSPEDPRPSSEIVQTGAQVLSPLVAIFATYIIMNGHLS